MQASLDTIQSAEEVREVAHLVYLLRILFSPSINGGTWTWHLVIWFDFFLCPAGGKSC